MRSRHSAVFWLVVIFFSPALYSAEDAAPPISAADLKKAEPTPAIVQALNKPEEKYKGWYLQLLRHPDADVRVRAMIIYLNSWEPDDEIKAMIPEMAKDPNDSIRSLAVIFLGRWKLATPEARKVLESLYVDSSNQIRAQAVEVAGELGKEVVSTGPALVKALDKAEGDLKAKMLQALVAIGPPADAEEKFFELFPECGAEAIHALGGIEPPPVKRLAWARDILAKDETLEHRKAAAWLLGRFNDWESLAPLSKSPEVEKRRLAMQGCYGLPKHTAETFAALEAGLKDADQDVRMFATQAVGMSSTLPASPPPPRSLVVALCRNWSDLSEDFREHSRSALEYLVGDGRYTSAAILEMVDAELAKSPKDLGLLLAKARLSHLVGADLLQSKTQNEEALKVFNSGSRGIIQGVYKAEYKLSPAELELFNGLFYDAACAASLCKRHELAGKYLEESLNCGWKDMEHLLADEDLEPFRGSEIGKAFLKKNVPADLLKAK